MAASKPAQASIEITFTNQADIPFFPYMALQNFYTYSITVKQFMPPNANPSREEMKNEAFWTPVLKNYRLMKNAHYEGDAQSNHIIGVELFNSKFNIKTLRTLRIYLN